MLLNIAYQFFFFYTNFVELRLKRPFQPPFRAQSSLRPPATPLPAAAHLLVLPPPTAAPLPAAHRHRVAARPRRCPLPVVYAASGFASPCGPSSSRGSAPAQSPASGLPPLHAHGARLTGRRAASKRPSVLVMILTRNCLGIVILFIIYISP